MDQDTLFKGLFFAGFYGIAFFLVYLFGRGASPKLAIWYPIGSWIFLMTVVLTGSGTGSALLFFPVLITSLFLFRRQIDNNLQAFFSDNRIYKATTIPEQVSALLGSHFYSCADVTLTTQSGKAVRFNWWQGMTSSTIKTGNSYSTTFNHYLAVSFPLNTVNEAFKRAARAKADTSGFTFRQKFRRFFILDTDTPCRIDETQDGSFIIMWQTYQDAKLYAGYLDWLKSTLSASEPSIAKELSIKAKSPTWASIHTPITERDRPLPEHAQPISPSSTNFSSSHRAL
jgi:hypothetical protein